MKQCPTCNRTYTDDTQSFCLEDGSPLTPLYDADATQVINPSRRDSVPLGVLPRDRTSLPPSPMRRTNPVLYVVLALLALIAGGGLVALLKSTPKETQVLVPPTSKPSATVNKIQIPTNVALNKPVTIVTNGADDNRGVKPADVTDGSLEYVATGDVYDSCIGWQNFDYGELMVINVTIDLQQTHDISKIRYNMGNVTRADSWNADIMVTPFGSTKTNRGASFSGAWTEQTGSLTASSVTITLKKTRTSPNTDWLFIGEIEVIGKPTR